MSQAQIRERKKHQAAVEADIKLKFLEQVIQQIDKRIENCNFQTNILRKKKKLFNIYGGKQVQNASLNLDYGSD